MRHATAPGVGDPPGFRLGDCSTQRNLSAAGREEARAVGERFRRNGVAARKVATSQWCRARDTAAEMAIGPVVEEPRVNSFFDAGDRQGPVAASREAVLEALTPGPVTVFVTHQVNVTALTGAYPASGEIVVVRKKGEELEVVGTLKP
ncbi:histidine phosphatase family protein [Hansschlegelia zhihuaiae]|nr:histidine phosphatase family protein [Hansschlegelia zhihuaiae]